MRIFGIDGGIASIGWAALDVDDGAASITAAGVRTFDAPETDKERTPTNAVGAYIRGERRGSADDGSAEVTFRFQRHTLLADTRRDASKNWGRPVAARAEGLE